MQDAPASRDATYAARWFEPGAGDGRGVDVTPTPAGLSIRGREAEGEALVLPWDGLELAWGGTDRTMVHVRAAAPAGRGDLFVAEGEAFLAAATRVAPPEARARGGTLLAGKRRRRRVLAILLPCLAVALVAGAVGVWRFVLHVEDRLVRELIPVSVEASLSAQVAQAYVAGKPRAAEPVREAIQRITQMLLAAWDERARERYAATLDVQVVEEPSVNAMALPAGTVIVHTGLVAFAESADEVAFVLGHEMAHVANRDGLAQLVSAVKWHLVYSYLVGDAGGIQELLVANATSLLSLRYSRTMERRADAEGLALATRAGFDPEAMPKFLERLASREGSLERRFSFLSDHPATAERVRAMAGLVKTLRTHWTVDQQSRPLLDWERVRRATPEKGPSDAARDPGQP